MALHPVVFEGLVFAGFLSVAYAAYRLHQYAEKRQHNTEPNHGPVRRWLVKRASRFVFLLSCAVGHPATLQATHEYAVHFIVYSGYVIRGH